MANTWTETSDSDVRAFLDQVEPKGRNADAAVMDALFREVTGWQPKLWGTMVGYGSYDYVYETGHSGTALATGFAPRKAKMVLYIMPGYTDFGHILKDVGPHKLGKCCLYLGALSKVNLDAIKVLVRAGLDDLATRHTVKPS